jgi:hypothetical protein
MIRTVLNKRTRFLCCLSVLLATILVANAQDQSFEGFVSGIRANAVQGDVSYERDNGKSRLEAGLKLLEGDTIRSGAKGYSELLIQPGNYLRVSEDSECQLFSTAHDRMRLKLNQGAITIEILARESEASWSFYETMSQRYELIRVITPGGEVFVTQSGVFRINVMPGGRTDLVVRKGEAFINGRRVKERRKAIASGDDVTIVDIDTKNEDSFDVWSRERADKLVYLNRFLKKASVWSKVKRGEEASVEFPEEAEEGAHKSTYVVSAKPGGVNFVEAGVEFSRGEKEWEPFTEESQMETGDKLRTNAHSFAELTLLPDINFRLDQDSEVLFEQLSNDSISVKLLRGSAILDVIRFDRKQMPPIALAGSSTSFAVADDGNYRIDIKPKGEEITVRDGKVIFKERSVGACSKIIGGSISDCDKKRTDSFDFWSEHRGEGKTFNGRETVSMVTHLTKFRRLRVKNTGFWYQNPGQSDYTFVPYSSQGLRSPYGGNYSTVLSPRRQPVIRLNTSGRPPVRFPEPPVNPPRPRP